MGNAAHDHKSDGSGCDNGSGLGLGTTRPAAGHDEPTGLAPKKPRPDFHLLRFRLHVVGNYEPAPVNFLVDVRDDVVDGGLVAVLHFLCPALLTHIRRVLSQPPVLRAGPRPLRLLRPRHHRRWGLAAALCCP